jgi:predicted regulator of Ras-like GTPase activity (Roadblock/LC7/MglB family)
MEVVLQQISMIPGVMGCFICNGHGHPLARSFPSTFDSAILKRTTPILIKIAEDLQMQTSSANLFDQNYDVGRIIVKQIQEGFLAILCTNSVNMQILTISLNVAQNKIKNLMLTGQFLPAPHISESPTISQSEPLALAPKKDDRLRIDSDGVILTIDSMKVSTSIKWDQMEENIAVSKKLALEIQSLFNTGPSKKFKLANRVAGCSKTFSVRTFERDNDKLFDDKIVLTLAAAEALKAKPGDEITVEPVSGGGFFRWS